jgi:DNA invertase Pin-like site-specific DNA recombinase
MAAKKREAPARDVCVIYCRVSSKQQAAEDKSRLDVQEQQGLAKAKELGLQVLYVVKDAESAWVLDKRSKFQQVLTDAKAGKFSVMIVDCMDRFTRSEDLSEYMQVMTELAQAGVEPIFTQRTYERTPTGQLQQFLDAYVSGQEQASRRRRSLIGKRGRVQRDKRPIPGHKAPYGYRWVRAPDSQPKKTRLEKADDQSREIVERIWRYFLTDEAPTVRSLAMRLYRDHVPPPRKHSGVLGAGDRWYSSSIQAILHNGVYWGEPTAFTKSKYDEPVLIPAYGPAYVTPEEARRVHRRLATNQQYAKRNRQRDWGTLLHGGLARCATCGAVMSPHEVKQRNADGTEGRWLYYQCARSAHEGKDMCQGASVRADALDRAVITTLDDRVRSDGFLERIFATWDQDQEAAMGEVRRIEGLYKDTKQKVDNLAARLASYSPDDPAAAPVETTMRMLAEQLPGLAKQRERAAQAVERARNNTALRDDLLAWFNAWIAGFQALSRARQREFLLALNATVRVWRAGERTPQAQLVIKLPTSVLELPQAPGVSIDTDGTVRVDVDTAAAAWLATYERDTQAAVAETLEELGVEPIALEPPPATADDVMAAVQEELTVRRAQDPSIVNDRYSPTAASSTRRHT